MNSERTNQLCVNLSASQARKRLKGYGFGVRRVEAVDRKRSVIVHTATGEHLRELEKLFSDVIVPRADADTPEA
jgi:DNA transformation protein and related proteins